MEGQFVGDGRVTVKRPRADCWRYCSQDGCTQTLLNGNYSNSLQLASIPVLSDVLSTIPQSKPANRCLLLLSVSTHLHA